MKVRFISAWEALRFSYWFLPSVMAAGAMAVSYLTLYLDDQVKIEPGSGFRLIWSGNPEGARQLLASIMTSTITVAGVIFSVTIVAFAQASSQFGPRLLRSFMSDTGNQLVIGTFVSTFIFSISVMRAIRGTEENPFVPSISVSIAMILALLSMGVLIYFIHHAASHIQAPIVVEQVAKDFLHSVEKFDESGSETGSSPAQEEEPAWEDEYDIVRSGKSGYLRAIDTDGLVAFAQENDLVIRVKHRQGHFIIAGRPLAVVRPESSLEEAKMNRHIRSFFLIGGERTQVQDIEFAIDQLVEVAVRSLSPGINDPFTAINCIDWLGAGLSAMAHRDFPQAVRRDGAGKVRLILDHAIDLPGMVEDSFDQIRQNARGHVSVWIRLLEVIGGIIFTVREKDRELFLRQARQMLDAAERNISDERDLRDIKQRYREILSHTGGSAPEDQ